MVDVGSRFKRLFRLRFAVLYPLGAYMAFFSTPDDRSMLKGVVLMIAGVFMRLWSNGYAVKMDKLTTSGPYALVRNPLYLGTALIILGAIVMLKLLLPGLVFFAVVVLAYRRTIRKEEKMLARKFGAVYLDYHARVPALWPALRPYPLGEKWPFSWRRLWDSREHKVLIWVSIIVIGFHLKEEFLVEGEPFNARVIGFIAAACLLGVLDFVGELVRAHQRKG